MEIVRNFCPKNKYKIKCPYKMKPKFITIHNTANDASARNEIKYMLSNNNKTSYHYAVDDKEAIQAIPLNRNAWHAGDGNGRGNRESIDIEICYSKSGGKRFNLAEKNTAHKIDILQKGTKVNATKKVGNWYKIGTHRWIHAVRVKVG